MAENAKLGRVFFLNVNITVFFIFIFLRYGITELCHNRVEEYAKIGG